MRSQRGQGTIEYIAVVAVFAVLLAAAAALASGRGTGVANAVLGQVRRALCIVTGGACPAERRLPCVVASTRDSRHIAGSLFFVRLDGDRYVMREDMSDGNVLLVLSHRAGAGFGLGVGVRAKVALKGRALRIEGDAYAGAEGVLGYGEVYVARDDHEADEILRRLRHRLPFIGDRPEPSERFVEGGVRGLAVLGIGGPAAGAFLELLSENVLGARKDERSGNVTITLNGGTAGWAMLSSFMAGPSGLSDRQVALALTLDRDRRPIELALTATGTLAAGATRPAGLVHALRISDDGNAKQSTTLNGRRWELGARLDLRDPDVAAAWAAFRGRPTDADAIRALAEAVSTRASLDVRAYAVSSQAEGAALGIGAGAKLGGEFDHTIDRARLLAAATRPPGGLWEQRADCVAV